MLCHLALFRLHRNEGWESFSPIQRDDVFISFDVQSDSSFRSTIVKKGSSNYFFIFFLIVSTKPPKICLSSLHDFSAESFLAVRSSRYIETQSQQQSEHKNYVT